MRVYLHIGPGKTGTSTVQYLLQNKKEILLKYRIASMPNCLTSPDGNHHEFVKITTNARKIGSNHLVIFEEKLDEAIEYTKKHECDHLFISSDLFSSEFTVDDYSFLADKFLERKVDVICIVTFRNLYSIALSTIQQNIKNGACLSSIYQLKPYTYFQLLDRLIKVFEIDSIRIINFEQCILGNFFVNFIYNTTGVTLPNNCFDTVKINQGISRIQLRLINFINGYLKAERNPEAAPFRECFTWGIMNIIDENRPALSAEDVHYYKEWFAYDQSLIKESYPNLYSIMEKYNVFSEPEFLASESLNNLLSKPNIEEISLVFAVIESYISHPDFKGYFNRQKEGEE